MLDPQLLRNDLDGVVARLRKRGMELDTTRLSQLEARRKELQVRTQELQRLRNERSREIGKARREGLDTEAMMQEVARAGAELEECEQALAAVQAELEALQLTIPNLPHESVPEGTDAADNVEVRRWGEPRRFSFAPKDHVELGEKLGLLDFAQAAKIAGSRFSVMYGPLAQMHRALIQLMLDVHTREHGYTEVNVPYLVNPQSLTGTGQLPKFADDQFHVEKQDLYLVPTAEVPVTNLARDRIIPAEELPLRYVCHSPCFRSEAGSYGKDTRGMIRQHQFEKVELVQLVEPSKSYDALEELTS